MGGRGALRFSTQWTIKQTQSRLDEVEKRIANIDSAAAIIGKQAAQVELNRVSSSSIWTKDEIKDLVDLARREAVAEFYGESYRGALVTERKRLRQQMRQLESGQHTLFG